MIQEDKIKAILQRAIDNGWEAPVDNRTPFDYFENDTHGAWFYDTDGTGVFLFIEQVIFCKDFAKAFWGEEKNLISQELAFYPTNHTKLDDYESKEMSWLEPWQYHLKELVLRDNYIDYLYSFIKEEK